MFSQETLRGHGAPRHLHQEGKEKQTVNLTCASQGQVFWSNSLSKYVFKRFCYSCSITEKRILEQNWILPALSTTMHFWLDYLSAKAKPSMAVATDCMAEKCRIGKEQECWTAALCLAYCPDFPPHQPYSLPQPWQWSQGKQGRRMSYLWLLNSGYINMQILCFNFSIWHKSPPKQGQSQILTWWSLLNSI